MTEVTERAVKVFANAGAVCAERDALGAALGELTGRVDLDVVLDGVAEICRTAEPPPDPFKSHDLAASALALGREVLDLALRIETAQHEYDKVYSLEERLHRKPYPPPQPQPQPKPRPPKGRS